MFVSATAGAGAGAGAGDVAADAFGALDERRHAGRDGGKIT